MTIVTHSQRIMLETERSKVLSALANMEHAFHLTGSEFFTPGHPDNHDLDFFVQEQSCKNPFSSKPSLTGQLLALGFRLHTPDEYLGDPEIILVFRHSQAKIDIQIVRDAAAKLKAQRIIQVMNLNPKAYPDEARELWRRAMRAAGI